MLRQILTYSTFQITFLVFFLCSKNKNVPQLCAGEEGVCIPPLQLRFPSVVPRVCSVLTVLKVNKNHLLPLYHYLEVFKKSQMCFQLEDQTVLSVLMAQDLSFLRFQCVLVVSKSLNEPPCWSDLTAQGGCLSS